MHDDIGQPVRPTPQYQRNAGHTRLLAVAVIAVTALLLSCSKRNEDDLDVHGNGLTRYAERVLGVDPLSPTNPLVLIPVVNGEEPFVLTYEVPVRTDLISNRCELFLWDNGHSADASEIERRTNGTYLVSWDTPFAAFGQHALQLMLGVPFQSRTNVFGPKRIEDVTNLVQFTVASTSFGTRIFIEGKLHCKAADYKIEFFDKNTNLLNTIFGHSTVYAGSAVIRQAWDLRDVDGRLRNDYEFTAKVYIRPTPPGASNATPPSGVFPLPAYPLNFYRSGTFTTGLRP